LLNFKSNIRVQIQLFTNFVFKSLDYFIHLFVSYDFVNGRVTVLNIVPFCSFIKKLTNFSCAEMHLQVCFPLACTTFLIHPMNWPKKIKFEKSNYSRFQQIFFRFILCQVPGFKDVEYHPEAAIVNFYTMDSSIGGHTDHSEPNKTAPLGLSGIVNIKNDVSCFRSSLLPKIQK